MAGSDTIPQLAQRLGITFRHAAATNSAWEDLATPGPNRQQPTLSAPVCSRSAIRPLHVNDYHDEETDD
jgi:hypothetical protein